MNEEPEIYRTRLMQAEQTLTDARDIRDLGSSPKYILRRAYYSMIYGLLTLFEKDGIRPDSSDHACIISLFHEVYVINGNADPLLYRFLKSIYEINENSDLAEEIGSNIINDNLVNKTIDGATHFLDFVKSRMVTIH